MYSLLRKFTQHIMSFSQSKATISTRQVTINTICECSDALCCVINKRAYIIDICRKIARTDWPASANASDTELLAFYGMPDLPKYESLDWRVAIAIIVD